MQKKARIRPICLISRDGRSRNQDSIPAPAQRGVDPPLFSPQDNAWRGVTSNFFSLPQNHLGDQLKPKSFLANLTLFDAVQLAINLSAQQVKPERIVPSLFSPMNNEPERPAQTGSARPGRTVRPVHPSDLIRCGAASLEPLRWPQGGTLLSIRIEQQDATNLDRLRSSWCGSFLIYGAIVRSCPGRPDAERFSLSHPFIESSQYWVLQWAHPSLIMASDEGRTQHQEFKQEERKP